MTCLPGCIKESKCLALALYDLDRPGSRTRQPYWKALTHMLHVWHIYLQNWVIFRANVGNYSSTMEHMAKGPLSQNVPRTTSRNLQKAFSAISLKDFEGIIARLFWGACALGFRTKLRFPRLMLLPPPDTLQVELGNHDISGSVCCYLPPFGLCSAHDQQIPTPCRKMCNCLPKFHGLR